MGSMSNMASSSTRQAIRGFVAQSKAVPETEMKDDRSGSRSHMPNQVKVRVEIKRLYYKTTAATVEHDLQRAIELLKTLDSDAERTSVAGYMDGLSQLRSEWILARRRANRRRSSTAVSSTTSRK